MQHRLAMRAHLKPEGKFSKSCQSCLSVYELMPIEISKDETIEPNSEVGAQEPVLSLGHQLLVAVRQFHIHLAKLNVVELTLINWNNELVHFIDSLISLIFKEEAGSTL